jgi:hypothetical protein
MALEPISTAYFINLSQQSMFQYEYPLSLLGNGPVKRYRGNEYTSNNRIVGRFVFCAVCVVSRKVGD